MATPVVKVRLTPSPDPPAPPEPPATPQVQDSQLEKHLDLAMQYSWNWFSYHAKQRLNAFHYFLLLGGAVVVGYLKCIEMKQDTVAGIICSFGALVSLGFLCLDWRNVELVSKSEHGLDDVEKALHVQIRSVKDRSPLLTHSIWFRLIEAVTFVGFVVAAIDTKVKFLGLWQ